MTDVMTKSQGEPIQDFEYKLSNLGDSIFKSIGRKRTLLVLLQLREHKKLRNKEIAKNLGGISSSTLSSILKQLQKQGLISRKI